jgi:hypothetical protein
VGLAHRGAWPSLDNGFGPLGLFGPWPKQGKASPTSIAALDRPISAGRRRFTGEGGAEEKLRTKGKPWAPVGWKGDHHGGLAVVREDDDGWTTVTTQIGDRQR